jgi:hypothetical protein
MLRLAIDGTEPTRHRTGEEDSDDTLRDTRQQKR